MEKRPVLYTRLNEKEYEELRKIAHITGLSLSAIGRKGLELALKKYKKGWLEDDAST